MNGLIFNFLIRIDNSAGFRIIFAEAWGILFANRSILLVISQAFPGGK